MDRILIQGGRELQGDIAISGAKNAALPLMAASLLTDGTLTLSNLPHLADIAHMAKILAQHGVEVGLEGHGHEGAGEGRVLSLCARSITSTTAPYELVRKMRASFLVIGPLLARFGKAKVSLPGGCAIGTRPVDLHLRGLEAMGVTIDLVDGYVHAAAPKGGLRGATIPFPFVSVGATEDMMMAATVANGTTVLENAAREPEIVDLGNCLKAMGARISGLGTSRITIEGVDALSGTLHAVIPDRIETGTFIMAVGMTGGRVRITGARTDHIAAVLPVMDSLGLALEEDASGLVVSRRGNGLHGVSVTTEPFPGFPTDLQAQLMALTTVADGVSTVRETIFENRFMHVPELMRMGADISVSGQAATVRGVARLKGAPVMATDLRASVSLLLAGLAAEGETVVNRVYHLDRGFERIEEKLQACGAEVRRLKD
ncbi:MAG: UDP-N-acetylglucosamine 1-carboxyvinyltransferase [Alphaproteobacteria bacterium]